MRLGAFPGPRQLISFGPYRGDHTAALPAGASVALPLLVLLGLDRDRALETLLGVIIAMVITILTHERRQDEDG